MMENVVYFCLTDTADPHAAAHALLKQVLGFSAPLAIGTHGKPFFPSHPQVQFSLTHTRGAVACALSAHPVGLDVEATARIFRPALARRCFTAREHALAAGSNARAIAIWTRKEALLKRDGRGVTVPLCTLETLDCPDITTHTLCGFTLSVCGQGAFRVTEVTGDTE